MRFLHTTKYVIDFEKISFFQLHKESVSELNIKYSLVFTSHMNDLKVDDEFLIVPYAHMDNGEMIPLLECMFTNLSETWLFNKFIQKIMEYFLPIDDNGDPVDMNLNIISVDLINLDMCVIDYYDVVDMVLYNYKSTKDTLENDKNIIKQIDNNLRFVIPLFTPISEIMKKHFKKELENIEYTKTEL